jgi:hypothetical protein
MCLVKMRSSVKGLQFHSDDDNFRRECVTYVRTSQIALSNDRRRQIEKCLFDVI